MERPIEIVMMAKTPGASGNKPGLAMTVCNQP